MMNCWVQRVSDVDSKVVEGPTTVPVPVAVASARIRSVQPMKNRAAGRGGWHGVLDCSSEQK
jgi:hypothetical protein